MSSVVLSGDTSGTVTVTVPAIAGSNTVTIPAGTGTVAVQGVSTNIVSGTAVASTSGTAIDFTSIPSWVKRITVMLSAVSTNGNANVVLQVGSGSILTSGYTGSNAVVINSGATVVTNNSTSFTLSNSSNSSDSDHGHFVLTLIASNTWVGSGVVNNMNARSNIDTGSITLSGALDRVRITTSNGTDTFDAGSINIFYE